LHPTITINDYTYRGYIEGNDVFRAVCQSWDKQPEECKKGYNGIVRDIDVTSSSVIINMDKEKDKVRQRHDNNTRHIKIYFMVAVIILVIF